MQDQRTKRLVHQDLLRRASYRGEGKRLLLKSLKNNKNQRQGQLALLLNYKTGAKCKYSLPRIRNLCPHTGKSGSFFKALGLSRHAIKKKAESGLLQNYKSKSW